VIELVGIDHVQLSMPPGGEAEARRFYGSVLGLREVAKPAELACRGGCWFAGTAVGLAVHLGAEPGFRPLAKAHPALLIRDLEAARSLLAEAGVPTEDDDSGLPVRRCYIRDPFGNRIELVDARDAAFSESGII
jgi:catechol 2,3-dioxygenase-like lactoylglutathione lyase family enzyme